MPGLMQGLHSPWELPSARRFLGSIPASATSWRVTDNGSKCSNSLPVLFKKQTKHWTSSLTPALTRTQETEAVVSHLAPSAWFIIYLLIFFLCVICWRSVTIIDLSTSLISSNLSTSVFDELHDWAFIYCWGLEFQWFTTFWVKNFSQSQT